MLENTVGSMRALNPQNLANPPWNEIIDAGRFNAGKLATLLDWSISDMAKYLGKSTSALSRQPAASKDQARLGTLVALLAMILEVTGGNLDALVAWLLVPNWAFDNHNAKELILADELEVVRNLMLEFESGTLA